jgi:hypothetical protein
MPVAGLDHLVIAVSDWKRSADRPNYSTRNLEIPDRRAKCRSLSFSMTA